MNNFWKELHKPIIALAPMEGVTDTAFRQLCKEHGADVLYTEFISSDAIGHDARRAHEKMMFDPSEQPVICQIFGRDLAMFAVAAREIQKRGFAGIDINFGCPARKVVNAGSGVALLRNPRFARDLIARIVDEIDIPVSIKVRSKIRKERAEIAPDVQEWYTALDLVAAIADVPVAAIMIHGRSFEQGHSGEIDAAMIREVKERFDGIVIANGGILTPEHAKEMLEATGADGVAPARGAQGRPWIFQQIKDYLATGAYTEPSWEDITATALRHAELAEAAKGHWGILELRKHLAWYVHGFPGASQLRKELVRVESLQDIARIMKHKTAA
ncbi:MAG: tRNA-dihydrouridine synthase [Patescibacteria group bacterium]